MMNEMNAVAALLVIAILLAAVMIVLVKILVEQRVKERLGKLLDKACRPDDGWQE